MVYNTLSRPSKLVFLVSWFYRKLYNRVKRLSERLKLYSYLYHFDHVGDEVILEQDLYINKPHNISIGSGTYIGQYTVLNANAEITFGENCAIAGYTYFMTWQHVIDDRTVELRTKDIESNPIRVGDGAWVGYNAVVLDGVTIGKGAVVAAGAVVTDDVPDWTIVAGVPAEPIGVRTEDGVEWRG